MVLDNTVHMITNPPFGTRVSLAFDIDIASYTITPFYFFFSLIYTTGIPTGRVNGGDTFPIILRILTTNTAGSVVATPIYQIRCLFLQSTFTA